jgi:16S rRNA (uracil1498-N3)-methyltransferase
MQRFFVPPQILRESPILLPAEVHHHLEVLRLAPGTELLLLDGEGGIHLCRLTRCDRKTAQVERLRNWREQDSAWPLQLLQGLPKGDKMELILQKGTELGIGHFSPLHCTRSIPVPAAGREDQRLQRWQRIISEAARQCRRPALPHLDRPLPFNEALQQCRAALRLMLWEEESLPLAEVLPEVAPPSAALLVGPEGGFTADEAAQARRAGFVPVRFGPRIPRCETAGFAAASLLQFRYGDLGARASKAPVPEQDNRL